MSLLRILSNDGTHGLIRWFLSGEDYMNDWPSVSIIIACYNEHACIEKCLDSVLKNDYDFDKIEIIVSDGMSDDGTREVIEQYSFQYACIKMVDNPDRLKPAGLNRAMKTAGHDYIMILDAHTSYPVDYIKKIIGGSIAVGSDNYGGIIEVVPRENTLLGHTLAAVNSSPFAVGNAYYRIGSTKVRQVDTVPFGCYKKEIFDTVGLFNPHLPKAEDREFNIRVLNNGGTIYLDPTIKCTYYARSRLGEYWQWIKASGYWVFYASQYTTIKFRSWRNYVPLAFLLYLLVLALGSLLLPRVTLYVLLLPLGLYLGLNLFFSARIGVRKGSLLIGGLSLLIFPITHLAYGWGSLQGILSYLLSEPMGNEKRVRADNELPL